MRGVLVQFRREFHGLRTEGAGTLRETAAVALGVFIGCLPVYGLHLLICWAVGFAFGLNRLKMYLAANISNPLVAPWLLFAEVQAGAWLQRGSFHPLTLQEIKTTGVAELGVDLLIGSVFVGGALASLAAAGTYAAVRSTGLDRHFAELVRPRRRSVCRRQHHGLGIRARQAPRRSDLSRDVVRGCAHLGRDAARRGMRAGTDAGAPGGGAAGRRCRHVAARVAAAAAVRTDGGHRDAPAKSRRSRARPSRATPRSSKATRGRCRWSGRAPCCCSTCCT